MKSYQPIYQFETNPINCNLDDEVPLQDEKASEDSKPENLAKSSLGVMSIG